MSDTTTPPPAKDPLAVLEELLAKQKQGGASAGSAEPAADPAVVAQEAELARRQAEYERLREEAAVKDAQALAEQTQKMEEIAQSPEYQARVEQNKAVQDKKDQSADDLEGYGIQQLTTTRIPVSQVPGAPDDAQ